MVLNAMRAALVPPAGLPPAAHAAPSHPAHTFARTRWITLITISTAAMMRIR